ncbi:MAG: fimbrillin family protein [Candidatus Cryptobacteroides sp.]
MKKSLIFFAGLALMAAGCAKTEVVTSGPEGAQKGINFAAYASRTTKADPQEDVTNANFTSFKVTAIGNNAIYFDNVTFTKGASVWESSPLYFWPAYSLDFYAYNTPTKGTFTRTINATDPQTLSFTPSTTLAEQEDLVAAYAPNENDPSGPTNLNFKHYLTQVVVKALSNNANYEVAVAGVKLANLAGDGTYTFSTQTMKATEANKNSDTSSDYDEVFTAKTLNTTAQEVMKSDAEGGRWYLIPQNVNSWNPSTDRENTANGTYLALKVKITTSGFRVYPRTGEDYAWMAVEIPAELAFAQGKKYNVTVRFFGADGKGGAGYVDPEKPGDLDGDNDPDDDKGQKILGGAITFNASVDEWDSNTVNVTINL